MNFNSLKYNIRKWLTINTLFNLAFVVLILVLIFSPPAKTLVIRGLMKAGLFQPGLSAKVNEISLVGDVNFQGKSGKQMSLSSLKGKVVFINFWATWCPPCIAELPSINELYKKLKGRQDIIFIMADTDSNFSKSLPFIAKHGYDLPVYIVTTAIPQTMIGNTIPATVVIDKKGKIVFRHDGAADYTNPKFGDFLNKLIRE